LFFHCLAKIGIFFKILLLSKKNVYLKDTSFI